MANKRSKSDRHLNDLQFKIFDQNSPQKSSSKHHLEMDLKNGSIRNEALSNIKKSNTRKIDAEI